jgi:hypothetical protein
VQLYIQHQGRKTGPFPLKQVLSGLANGSYDPSDLAWHEGAPEWLPLSAVPGIAHTSPPALPEGFAQGAGASQTCTLAVWSLILGLLAFVSLGITAIPAVISGHVARRNIKRSAGSLTGGGFAIAGLITGYLSVIFITILAGLTTPLILRLKMKGDQTEALHNLKQIGVALSEFDDYFGSYPNDSTVAAVADASNTEVITGNSSNAYFRQLIRSKILQSEMPF